MDHHLQEIRPQCLWSGGSWDRYGYRDDGVRLFGMVQVFGGPGGVLEDWNADSGLLSFGILFGAGHATDPVAVVALPKELGARRSWER